MKKMLLIFLAVSFFYSGNVNAQCKFKKLKKAFTRYAISDDCNITADYATKPKVIFKKFSTGATTCFVKSGEKYYVFLYQVRGYSSRYEILKNNSLVAILDEGEPVVVYPCGDFRGKGIGIGIDYGIGCYYEITREQLQRIAENNIEMILIHITSDHEISGSQLDEDGTLFLEYTIHSENNSDNTEKGADCILSK